MEEVNKFRIKAFLWDLFILPIYSFFTTEQLRSIMIAILIINIFIFKSAIIFYIFIILVIITATLDLIRYYKSGEFIHNYRKYKYGDWKKAIKEKVFLINDDEYLCFFNNFETIFADLKACFLLNS